MNTKELYQENLNYLYTQLPIFSRIGAKAIKTGLGNIEKICSFLDDPQKKIKVIHVAGTNGKGSVSHLLASILAESGFKTGLYTSPHLNDFRERIKINGKMIPRKSVNSFVDKIKPIIEAEKPSFFEITVAMAFDYFANEGVDIAVIETGLGGRLDSTNIVLPILSVITNISYDHKDVLGDTLAAIAGEKAGIIKQSTPIIIGRRNEETDPVFIQKAQIENAPLIFSSDNLDNIKTSKTSNFLKLNFKNFNLSIKSPLVASYQIENINTTIFAIKQLVRFNISDKNIQKGIKKVIKNTGFFGRWQKIRSKPLTIIDVAHNEDGIKMALQNLKNESFENLHIIFGAVKDKDILPIFDLLPKDAQYYFTQANIDRKLDISELAKLGLQFDLNFNTYPTPEMAFEAAECFSNKNDLILIIGSFFIVNSFL